MAVNTLVNAKSPRAVLLKNPSTKAIKIYKNLRLRTITENINKGYFTTLLINSFKTLAIATVTTAITAHPAN